MKETMKLDDFGRFSLFIREIKPGRFRKKLGDLFSKEMKYRLKVILEPSIQDKHITEKEVNRVMKKYDVKRDTVAEIMQPFYEEGFSRDDGKKQKQIIMVAMPGADTLKLKDYAKKNFKIEMMCPEEAMHEMDAKQSKDKANYIG